MFSIYIILAYVVLVAIKPTRRIALALTPWIIFACSYDAMRLYPNYMVNNIDVRNLYEAELSCFGITLNSGETVIPGAFLSQHHQAVADVMAGLFIFVGYQCRWLLRYTYIYVVVIGCVFGFPLLSW